MKTSNRKQSGELAYLLADAIRHAKEAFMITTAELDPPGPEIVYVNERFCQMSGYASEELIGKTPRIMQGPRTDRSELDRLRHQLSLGESYEGEIVNYRKDASEYVIEWYIVPLRDSAGKITQWMASQRDVTDRKVLEEKLRHQTLHDPLTNLPNRALFVDRLEHALSLAVRDRKLNAVLFVDLDEFKVVNDSLGHEAGDALLVQVAERLRAGLRAEDTVARFGGDEFGILLEDVPGPGYVADVAKRIIQRLRETFALEGRELTITCSIGTVLAAPSQILTEAMLEKADLAMYEAKWKGKERFAREVLRKADLAMYEAKRKGKGRNQMFDPGMNTRAMNRLELESALRRGLEREEFIVYYQTVVSLKTGKVRGLEALVRWDHPERGLVLPSEFIPVAEESGLIGDIGRWVLKKACSQVRRWQDSFPGDLPLRVNVNLSARQLYEPNLANVIADILAETDLDPHHLELEITENVIMEDAQSTLATLGALKSLGIGLAIDDFGTGYSSLAHLKRFPIDTLKIGDLFVADLGKRTEDEAIMAAIIGLAHGLDLTIISERVETAEQLRRLHEMGCDLVQGFYFSRPSSAEAMETLLPRNHLDKLF